MDLCRQSDVSAFKYTVSVYHGFPSKEQASFNFMAAVIVYEKLWWEVEDLDNVIFLQWWYTFASGRQLGQGLITSIQSDTEMFQRLASIFVKTGFYWLSQRTAAVAAAKLLQSCPTLCDPIDDSPLGSPIPGILQARTPQRTERSSSVVMPSPPQN